MQTNTLHGSGLADLLAEAQVNETVANQPAEPQVPIEAHNPAPLAGLPGGAPVVPAVPAIPPGTIEIDLSEPVSVKGGALVDAIYLRQPTLGDWLDCGDLMQTIAVEAEGGTPKIQVSVDPQAAVKWFARLSGQNIRFFRSLPLRDWKAILGHLQVLAGDAGSENPMM